MTEATRPNLALVLRELIARHATGVLAITTGDAPGEVRLRLGQIEDVVLGRAEGLKALARMLAATDLKLAFRDASAGWIRRVDVGSEALLAEAIRLRDEIVRALEPFASRGDSHAIGLDIVDASRGELSSPARMLWSKLRAPTSLQELLDLSPESDPTILDAAAELEKAGGLRWLAFESERQPLGPARWDVARLRDKLGASPRIVIAGTPQRLAVFAHALLYVDDAIRAPGETPLVPMPQPVATIGLEALRVEVISCPLVPVYSPLWPLSVEGAALVVRLDEAAPGLLEGAAEMVGVRVVAAEALVGPLDEARVGAAAALVRAALEEAAG
jgi:hypothetical protein